MFSNPPQRHGCSGDSSGARIGRGDQSVVATSVDVGPHQRGACNGSSSGIVEDDGGRRVAGGIPLETKDSSSRKSQKVDDGNGRVEHDVDDCGRSVKGARDTIAGRARDRVEDGGDDHCRLRRDRRTRTSSEGGGAGIGSGTSGVVGAGDIDGAEYVEVVVDPGNAAASGVAGGFSADDHDDGYSDASFAPDDDSNGSSRNLEHEEEPNRPGGHGGGGLRVSGYRQDGHRADIGVDDTVDSIPSMLVETGRGID